MATLYVATIGLADGLRHRLAAGVARKDGHCLRQMQVVGAVLPALGMFEDRNSKRKPGQEVQRGA